MQLYSKRAIKLSNRIKAITNINRKPKRASMVDGIHREQNNTHHIFNERYIITNEYHPQLHDSFVTISKLSNLLYNAAYKVERARFLNGDHKIYYYKDLKDEIYNGYRKEQLHYGNNPMRKLIELFFNIPKTIRLGVIFDVADIWYKFYTTNNNTQHHKIPLPKYRKGNDRRYSFTINHNQITQVENHIRDTFKNYEYLLKLPEELGHNLYIPTNIHISSIIDVRITPNRNRFIVDIKYNIEKNLEYRYDSKDIYKVDRSRIAGIDFGVNNLIAIANNVGTRPLLIDGKRLAAINVYYNKMINNTTKRKALTRLINRRENIIRDYLNKAAKKTINYLESHCIKTLVLGINGALSNGFMNPEETITFKPIDYNYLVNRIKLLCYQYNIKVIEVDELFTSNTSILDGQLPIESNQQQNRRFTDRLYMTQNFGIINADINSAMQIICKYDSHAFDEMIKRFNIVNYLRPIQYKNYYTINILNNDNVDNIIKDYTVSNSRIYYGKNGKLNMTTTQFIRYLIDIYYKFGFKNVASKALLMTNDTIRKLMGALITPLKVTIDI